MSQVAKIKELCDKRNARLIVVLLPDEMQVDLALQARVVEASNLNEETLDFMLPNRLLRESLQQLKIDHLDLTPEFLGASATQRLYRPNDSHWNIAGNRLAAHLIGEYIAKQFSQQK
jgi:hypothetical protein